MAKKIKIDRNAPEPRDRKRDRHGWKAERAAARQSKGARRAYEMGEKK